MLQESAPWEDGEKLEEAAVFLLERGRIVGPERLSTLGVRAVKEQTSVGSSLFAQPLMLQAVPLEDGPVGVTESPEMRAGAVLERLEERAGSSYVSESKHGAPDLATLSDHLSLFRRWYYRPEKQRTGEVFLPNPDGGWPIRRVLNGAARVALGPPAPVSPADREAAKALKTKIIHAGREGVEREVPVLPKRSRTRKAVTPADLAE